MKKISLFFLILCFAFFLVTCQSPVIDSKTSSATQINELNSAASINDSIALIKDFILDTTNDSTNDNIIKDIGTIKYINLSGGFYGIIGDSGKRYEPINLPEKLKIDGLRVKFSAYRVLNTASIYMWGTIIKIIEIYPLPVVTVQPTIFPTKVPPTIFPTKFPPTIFPTKVPPTIFPTKVPPTIAPTQVPPIKVLVGEDFKLLQTQSAYVINTNNNDTIKVQFVKVLSDSRCPKGAVCIQAGEAVIQVNITLNDTVIGDFKMTTRDKPSTVDIGKYVLYFNDLWPYPTLAMTDSLLPQPEYVAYFIVKSKEPSIDPIKVLVGEEFKLIQTQTAYVISTDSKDIIKIEFSQVISDSRCPRGVECFWAGEAIILVNVTLNDGRLGQFKMSTLNPNNTIDIGRYKLYFNDLWPYPVYDKILPPQPEYVAYFVVKTNDIIIQK